MYKLSAYQRIEALTDRNSFEEIGAKGESAITGMAKIKGRQVFVIATDITVHNGSLGQNAAKKINTLADMAVKYKCPLICMFESVGARVQEGVVAMHHIGILFRKFGEISGVVPTIAILIGVNSGATAYTASLMDFVIMVEDESYAFITGPKVVEQMISAKETVEELGGTSVHGAKTGLATFIEKDETQAIQKAQQLLDYLPQYCFEDTKAINQQIKKSQHFADLLNIIPHKNTKQGYDMSSIIDEITDDHSCMNLFEDFAPNLIVSFAKLGGSTIGIAANQPLFLSGILDVDSCKKLFRFIQLCDAYNIPLLFIADSPGFMPGKEQEQSSVLSIGGRVLNVLATTTVPKVTLIVNKIIGGAYGGMSSKGLGADLVYAWPSAQIAVFGTSAALSVIYHKEIQHAEDKEAVVLNKINEFETKHLSPYPAAEHGQIDAVIHPYTTRKVLLHAFSVLQNKVSATIKKRRTIIPM